MPEIKLTKGFFTLVDEDMLPMLSSVKWLAKASNNRFYAAHFEKDETGKRRVQYMHHVVIGRPLGGVIVDHINGNSMDNRRENLRLVSNRVNQQNSHKNRAGRLPGCHYNKRDKRWQAQITVSGKKRSLGMYATEAEAHAAYMKAVGEIS